jgi:hypothetical protein
MQGQRIKKNGKWFAVTADYIKKGGKWLPVVGKWVKKNGKWYDCSVAETPVVKPWAFAITQNGTETVYTYETEEEMLRGFGQASPFADMAGEWDVRFYKENV